MTAREVLDELERWGRLVESGDVIGRVTPKELHDYWLAQVADLRRQIEAEDSTGDAPAPTAPNYTNAAGGLVTTNGVRLPDSEPSALEVALRLIEAGKVAAVPRQAAAFACDLIDCIRARQSKEVGR